MKSIKLIALVIVIFLLSACSAKLPASPTSTPGEAIALDTPTPSANTPFPLLTTSMGDFVVLSTRLVDQAHEDKAPDGYKFLLIGLVQPDMQKLIAGQFSFEAFQSMASGNEGEIYVLGSDGSKTDYRGVGGWLDNDEPVSDDFVMGFLVPIAETYTLYWADNPPIPLSIEP